MVLLVSRADESAAITAVRMADDARVAAMIAADAKQLDEILSDQLHYAHSAKLIETKSEHIDMLASKRGIYREVEYKNRDFTVLAPGVVVMKGRAIVKVGGPKMLFLVDINFLAVWRFENDRWRLFAWQSSRNEDPTPVGSP